MATVFKGLTSNDVTTTRTRLHEAIPLTGTIVSGVYGKGTGGEPNVKNYSHGLFQSVYDYPYLSSSANHIFDISIGYSADSALSGVVTDSGILRTAQADKINMYNQMAQILVGHDVSGNIRRFDRDGDFSTTEATGLAAFGTPATSSLDNGSDQKMDEVVFVNFARLLSKDEIKKGSFRVTLETGSYPEDNSIHAGGHTTSGSRGLLTLGDYSGSTEYRVNSPAGEYGLLYTGSQGSSSTNPSLGIVYYQAGIAVVSASVFARISGSQNAGDANDGMPLYTFGNHVAFGAVSSSLGNYTASIHDMFRSGSIQNACDGFRNRLANIEFNNTTELNSTIYFCRVNHNDYNYSTNPSYLSSSKIVVKDVSSDLPVSYLTTVGLYSADNELLAVAKLSEPIKKDPNNEVTLRVRLDY